MTDNDSIKTNNFINLLRDEIQKLEERRTNYVRQKFTYIIGLIGLGSVSIGKIQMTELLYIVPFVALAFDMYILGEDHGVKRAGNFLARPTSQASSEEVKWERFVRGNRDPFSKFAGWFLSILVMSLSTFMLFKKNKIDCIFTVWILIYFICLFILLYFNHEYNKKFDNNIQSDSYG